MDGSRSSLLADLGPLYHRFHLFGVHNEQLPGIFEANQKAKEPILASYILHAIAKSKQHVDDQVTFAELFCADGYYAMLARHFGAARSVGIDDDSQGFFETAHRIRDRLTIDACDFVKADVNTIHAMEPVDIVANVGGLYHVGNPEEILDKSYAMARKFLIVQTVVSLANDEPDYFEAPAPEWHWGSRYNPHSFHRMIAAKGWTVVDTHLNELEGNSRAEDRGSIYYLISKQPSARA